MEGGTPAALLVGGVREGPPGRGIHIIILCFLYTAHMVNCQCIPLASTALSGVKLVIAESGT